MSNADFILGGFIKGTRAGQTNSYNAGATGDDQKEETMTKMRKHETWTGHARVRWTDSGIELGFDLIDGNRLDRFWKTRPRFTFRVEDHHLILAYIETNKRRRGAAVLQEVAGHNPNVAARIVIKTDEATKAAIRADQNLNGSHGVMMPFTVSGAGIVFPLLGDMDAELAGFLWNPDGGDEPSRHLRFLPEEPRPTPMVWVIIYTDTAGNVWQKFWEKEEDARRLAARVAALDPQVFSVARPEDFENAEMRLLRAAPEEPEKEAGEVYYVPADGYGATDGRHLAVPPSKRKLLEAVLDTLDPI